MFDQSGCEPIEQFRMTGALAIQAEIISVSSRL